MAEDLNQGDRTNRDHLILLRSLRGRNVFISGRMNGLQEERDRVDAFLTRYGATVYRFEKIATDNAPNEMCKEWARTCDLYIGIYGDSYGDPIEDERSPTELEYDEAISNHRHLMIYIKRGQRDERQIEFINKVRDWRLGVNAPSFTDANELIELLNNSLEIFYSQLLIQSRTPDLYQRAQLDVFTDVTVRPTYQEDLDEFLGYTERNPEMEIKCDELEHSAQLNNYPPNIRTTLQDICNEHGPVLPTAMKIFRENDEIYVRYTYT